jgi:hypothetical protein
MDGVLTVRFTLKDVVCMCGYSHLTQGEERRGEGRERKYAPSS